MLRLIRISNVWSFRPPYFLTDLLCHPLLWSLPQVTSIFHQFWPPPPKKKERKIVTSFMDIPFLMLYFLRVVSCDSQFVNFESLTTFHQTRHLSVSTTVRKKSKLQNPVISPIFDWCWLLKAKEEIQSS